MEILLDHGRIIAVNKPHGLLVHRSSIARDAEEFALQMVRDMVGAKVFPVHRLDRKTSGVLLFARDAEMQSILNELFQSRGMSKEYLAIVRGYMHDEVLVDYPLQNERGNAQEAVTQIYPLAHAEIPLPSGHHTTSRYSLVKCVPHTGRMHQIRRHLAHLRHPILGDRPHGCNKQNRIWKAAYSMETMMLHAYRLRFHLPNGEPMTIEARPSQEFDRVSNILGINTLKQHD
ncbi:MAG: pseudouridylate synthase [Flavobacteriales bacterium]|nr:pseudouridylate synthase [Flavobacteriales bacterium]